MVGLIDEVVVIVDCFFVLGGELWFGRKVRRVVVGRMANVNYVALEMKMMIVVR